jgi:hypothetical protein
MCRKIEHSLISHGIHDSYEILNRGNLGCDANCWHYPCAKRELNVNQFSFGFDSGSYYIFIVSSIPVIYDETYVGNLSASRITSRSAVPLADDILSFHLVLSFSFWIFRSEFSLQLIFLLSLSKTHILAMDHIISHPSHFCSSAFHPMSKYLLSCLRSYS